MEKEIVLQELTAMVHENAVKEQNQEEYQRRYKAVEGEMNRLDTEIEKLKTKKADNCCGETSCRYSWTG